MRRYDEPARLVTAGAIGGASAISASVTSSSAASSAAAAARGRSRRARPARRRRGRCPAGAADQASQTASKVPGDAPPRYSPRPGTAAPSRPAARARRESAPPGRRRRKSRPDGVIAALRLSVVAKVAGRRVGDEQRAAVRRPGDLAGTSRDHDRRGGLAGVETRGSGLGQVDVDDADRAGAVLGDRVGEPGAVRRPGRRRLGAAIPDQRLWAGAGGAGRGVDDPACQFQQPEIGFTVSGVPRRGERDRSARRARRAARSRRSWCRSVVSTSEAAPRIDMCRSH